MKKMKIIMVLIILLAALDAFLVGIAIGRTLMPRKDDSTISVENSAVITWESDNVKTWEDVIEENILTENIE